MLRSLWQQFDSLVLREGEIYRSFYDQQGKLGWYQLILPNEMKQLLRSITWQKVTYIDKRRQTRS